MDHLHGSSVVGLGCFLSSQQDLLPCFQHMIQISSKQTQIWALVWLSGNLSWKDWCSQNLVPPSIHRKPILSSQEPILHSKDPKFPQIASQWNRARPRLPGGHCRSVVWGTQGMSPSPSLVRGAAEDSKAAGDMRRCEGWTENRSQGVILKMVQTHTNSNSK